MKKMVIELSTLGLFSLSYYYFHKHSRIEPYWGENKISSRNPASVLDQLSPEIEIYKDFFSYDSYQKRVSYDLDVKLRTDVSEEYLKKKAELALHDSFRISFEKMKEVKEKDPPLIGLFKEGLIESFTTHFVKTIGALRLVNSTFQIDFSFVPKIHKDLNYIPEFSSNQLIQWNDTGSFYDELTKGDLSLQEQILKTKIPANDKPYQYYGGQLSIWLKVLDMHPRFDIPDPKKNAVKGFLRFRRYYKANDIADLKPFLRGQDLKMENVKIEMEKGKKDFFVTVDVFKEFSLGSIMPKLDRMDIHFGTLQPDNLYKNSFIGMLFTNDNGTIKTGEIKIKGQFKADDGSMQPFRTTLERLSYDFNKKSFDIGASKLFTTTSGPSSGDEQRMRPLNMQFEEMLLKHFAPELIEGLSLKEFHHDVGGAQ